MGAGGWSLRKVALRIRLRDYGVTDACDLSGLRHVQPIEHLAKPKGLAKNPFRAERGQFFQARLVQAAGDDGDDCSHLVCADVLKNLCAVAIGQAQIKQQAVRGLAAAHFSQAQSDRRNRSSLKPSGVEQLLEQVSQRLVIFDNQCAEGIETRCD